MKIYGLNFGRLFTIRLLSSVFSYVLFSTLRTKILKMRIGAKKVKAANGNDTFTFNGKRFSLTKLWEESLGQYDDVHETSFAEKYKNGALKFYSVDNGSVANAFASASSFRGIESVTVYKGLSFAIDQISLPNIDIDDERYKDADNWLAQIPEAKAFRSQAKQLPHNSKGLKKLEIQLKKKALQAILFHELTHLKNRDVQKQGLFKLILGRLPGSFLFSQYLSRQCEHKADRGAAEITNNQTSYGPYLILALNAIENSGNNATPWWTYLLKKLKTLLFKNKKSQKGTPKKPRARTLNSSFSLRHTGRLSRVFRPLSSHPTTPERKSALEKAEYKNSPFAKLLDGRLT